MEIFNNAINAVRSYLWVPFVIIIGVRILSYLAHGNDNSDTDKKN